jgi:hypothetical protein
LIPTSCLTANAKNPHVSTFNEIDENTDEEGRKAELQVKFVNI